MPTKHVVGFSPFRPIRKRLASHFAPPSGVDVPPIRSERRATARSDGAKAWRGGWQESFLPRAEGQGGGGGQKSATGTQRYLPSSKSLGKSPVTLVPRIYTAIYKFVTVILFNGIRAFLLLLLLSYNNNNNNNTRKETM